jgi:hypothetical protein
MESVAHTEPELGQDEAIEMMIGFYLWGHDGPVVCKTMDPDPCVDVAQAFEARSVDPERFMYVLRSMERRRLVKRRVQQYYRLVMFTHQEPALRPVLKFSFTAAYPPR